MDLELKQKTKPALLCGLLGCLCFGAGDWLMLYGDTAYVGCLSWLTVGAAEIAPWRNSLAMALAFTNGLMSESMLIWFGSMLLWNVIHKNNWEESHGAN